MPQALASSGFLQAELSCWEHTVLWTRPACAWVPCRVPLATAAAPLLQLTGASPFSSSERKVATPYHCESRLLGNSRFQWLLEVVFGRGGGSGSWGLPSMALSLLMSSVCGATALLAALSLHLSS